MSEGEGSKGPRSPRPQSMMAQNFSLALDGVFGLGSAAELEQDLDKKEESVTNQQAELEALEARLRATEERLKASKIGKAAEWKEEDDDEWMPISKRAPVLPGMGLRANPEASKAKSATLQKGTSPDDSDDDGDDTESSSEEDEDDDDEDSTEETSEDEATISTPTSDKSFKSFKSVKSGFDFSFKNVRKSPKDSKEGETSLPGTSQGKTAIQHTVDPPTDLDMMDYFVGNSGSWHVAGTACRTQ